MKPNYQRIENETFKMINQLRNTPSSFIKELEKLALTFNGKTYRLPGSKVNIVTAEGRYAVDDAIKFLKVHIFPLLFSSFVYNPYFVFKKTLYYYYYNQNIKNMYQINFKKQKFKL